MNKTRPYLLGGSLLLAAMQIQAATWNEFPYGTNTSSGTNLCDNSSYQCYEGDSFSNGAPAEKAKLTVLSYNIMRAGADRTQNIIGWIKDEFGEQGPDVILLSETSRGGNCSGTSDNTREIAKAFNAYYVNGNEDDKVNCQTGNSIVSRYPLGNVHFERMTSQGNSGGAPENKNSGRSFIKADMKVGDELVHVYSTHTHHTFAVDWTRHAQHKQMAEHAATQPYTKIIGGDFNTTGQIVANCTTFNGTVHDWTLNPFYNLGLENAHDGFGGAFGCRDRITDVHYDLTLDHIFAAKGSTSNAGICDSSDCNNDKLLSDHKPIWTDVAVQKRSQVSALDLGDYRSDNWVAQVFEGRGNTRLRDMVIPGSHDAATYSITKDSPLAPDGQWFYDILGSVSRGVAAVWSKTQSYNLYDQLKIGVRHFDLRILKNSSGQFINVHGLEGASQVEVLNDVKRFADEHPKEPIILEIAKRPEDADMPAMLDQIRSIIGNRLYESGSQLAANVSLQNIWDSGRNVIVVTLGDNALIRRKGMFGYSENMEGIWADTTKWSELNDRLVNGTSKQNGLNDMPSNKLHWAAITYTPGEDLIIKSTVSGVFDPLKVFGRPASSIWDMNVRWLRETAYSQMLSWEEKGLRPNIITSDFTEITPLVAMAVRANTIAPVAPSADLKVTMTTDSTSIWGDNGSGGAHDVTILDPYANVAGAYKFGSSAIGRYNPAVLDAAVPMVIAGHAGVVKPVGFAWVWDDRKSGSDKDFTVWRPIAPKGFTCLGDTGIRNHSFQFPSTENTRCVHNSYVQKASSQKWIWNDDDTGSSWDGEFRIPTGGLSGGAIVAQRSWSLGGKHWDTNFNVLNASKVQYVTANAMRLTLRPEVSYSWIYDSVNTGADDNVSIWRPNTPAGYYRLGDYAVGHYGRPPAAGTSLVVKDEGNGLLAKPTKYVRIWTDAGSGGTHDAAIWKAIAPSGYSCLGYLATSGAKPSTNDMRCVANALLTQGSNSKVWDDDDSGSDTDVGFWRTYAFNADSGVNAGTFRANTSHSNTGSYSDYKVIRADRANVSAYRELKNGTGKCLAIAGGIAKNWANVVIENCNKSVGQMWLHDLATARIHSAQNPDFCINNRGYTYSGPSISMYTCSDHDNRKWDRVGKALRSRHDHNIVMDAFGSNHGSNVGLYAIHGGSNQQWTVGAAMNAEPKLLSFERTVEAAISGYNNESLSNVSPEQCAAACTAGSRANWCVSFDYIKTTNKCDLSSKRASDVGGLKTTYARGLLDHYSLK